MARTTKTLKLKKGRDKGKILIITEMSAWNSNRWMIGFVKQLAKSGVELPSEISDLGIAGLLGVIQEEGDTLNSPTFFKALLSLASNVNENELFLLLDGLLACVEFRTEGGHEIEFNPDQIEESASFNVIYSEVFQVHNFF